MNNTTYGNKAKARSDFFSSPFGFIIIVGGTVVLGFLAGLASGSFLGYGGIARPPLMPPDQVLMIITPITHFLSGCGLYYVLKAEVRADTITLRRAAVTLWCIQCALNFVWPFVFFTFGMATLAFIVVTLNAAAVIALNVMCFMLHRTGGILLVPYTLWLLFATYLNVFIALAN